MSVKLKESTNLVAIMSSIAEVDLIQTICRVKKMLLCEERPLDFDLFKQHSQMLRAVKELIAVEPKANGDTELAEGKEVAVEGFLFDVCLPFLYSFAPSYDGRAELHAAVLNICDLILVCLKRLSEESVIKIFEVCLHSLQTFNQECSRHSESVSDHHQVIDILCALELLCTSLEISIKQENNQNIYLYNEIFSVTLSILSHLEEKAVTRLISFVLCKLINQQTNGKEMYLHEIWQSVNVDVACMGEKMPPRTLQQHLTMMCSMVSLFLPLSLTEEIVRPDVRQHQTFWKLIQFGLCSDNPALRKRSMYLLKRIIDTCEKSHVDFIPENHSTQNCFPPYFCWNKQQQKYLSKIWEYVLLLLETLDEKQTHVIKPILTRMQFLISVTENKNGSQLLHTSWIVTILMRAFQHESIFITRWAAETVLFMDFEIVPCREQGQLQCLTQKLLGFLQDLKLYQRPDGSPVGSCSSIGKGLKHFFASVCKSLDSKKHKVEFLHNVLKTLQEENWSSVPLVFITQGLSNICPGEVLDHSALAYIREIIVASLTTLENFTRGAIECSLTKTILNLFDKSELTVDDFMETLAVMEREESLQRGTGLWSSVVSWLLAAAADNLYPSWSWDVLKKSLHTMLENYLMVSPDINGSPSETLHVTKLARFIALMFDCEQKMNSTKKDNSLLISQVNTANSLLSATLGKTVEIINSINTRVYIPVLKADKAVYLLFSCAREFREVTVKTCFLHNEELCELIASCWDELLAYMERRVLLRLSENDPDPVDLDLVKFYADAVKLLGGFLPLGFGMKSLEKLAESCIKIINSSSPVLPLHRVAAISLMSSLVQIVEGQLQDIEKSTGNGEEELKKLLYGLLRIHSNISLNCDIFTTCKGINSADHGRQVCQYMMSLWQCLQVLLLHKQGEYSSDMILDAALEAFSVSSGECDVAIMQCLELILPELLNNLNQQDKIVQVISLAWDKVHEEVKSWSFWLKMEAFVNMVLLHPLLMLTTSDASRIGAHITEVLKQFFGTGHEKSGLLNLVITRLCQLWMEPEGFLLATNMASTIVDACMFGTVHKKAERLWLDVCMYIETLKKDCSVNEILSSSSKNDIYVRLTVVNFLSTLKPGNPGHETLAITVLYEAWNRYETLAQMSTFRQFTNSLPHRQKHRLLQIFPLLDQFISQNLCLEFCEKAWNGLAIECHPSVRQNLEWLVMRLVHRYPHTLVSFLWKYFNQFSDKRNISLLSLLHIVACLGPELPVDLQEDYYIQAIPLVLPWSMAHHFNTRLHGQAALYLLWVQCEQMQLQPKKFKIVESCLKFLTENRNSSPVLGKLKDNYFFGHFHFRRDYSMETLFYTLPRLACISDDEWMHPDLFCRLDATWKTDRESHLVPLYNEDRTLASCEPGPWKMKATAETIENAGELEDGDVQKKIIPWRLMIPDSHAEQEYSCRKKGWKPDGLVLVTSLINKIPNLGGLCRTSEIFGVSEFVIGNLSYLNHSTFQSLSVTAEKWIPITEVPFFRLIDYLEEKKRESYTLVGVEQTANSVELTKYKFPKKTLLVLGNEKEGIPPDILQQLDVCVEIPQQGIIRSLNVHVSGALLVWEYSRQQMELSEAE